MSIDLMPLFVGRLIGYTKTEVKLGENYNDWKLVTKRYTTWSKNRKCEILNVK